MGKKDPKVDAYIAKSAAFARPILNRLRRLVHTACHNTEETIKWGFPHFMYERKILCSMAAFKHHCAFGFWHHAMRASVADKYHGDAAMGQFGRITALSDLPKDESFLRLINEAMKVTASAAKTDVKANASSAKSKDKKPIKIPADFRQALGKNRKASAVFEAFSPSHKREYVEWIAEAKREATRQKRLKTAIDWLSEGKSHNWRYERK